MISISQTQQIISYCLVTNNLFSVKLSSKRIPSSLTNYKLVLKLAWVSCAFNRKRKYEVFLVRRSLLSISDKWKISLDQKSGMKIYWMS